MDSPPLGPKPKSAVPSYLLNGSSPLHTPPEVKERDNLIASINASNKGREVVDLDATEVVADGHSSVGSNHAQRGTNPPGHTAPSALLHSHPHLTEAARDPRDEAPASTASRPASPYTANPPVDFDGLSWPSKLIRIQSRRGQTQLTPVGSKASVLVNGSKRRQIRRQSAYRRSQAR